MNVLPIISVGVAAVLAFLGFYLSRHPPELSALGLKRLSLALRLGTFCSTMVFCLFLAWIRWKPVSVTPNHALLSLAIVGNFMNASALFYSLREISAEGLVTAFLILIDQGLWILYLMVVLTVDF
jgi:hypothetical protein